MKYLWVLEYSNGRFTCYLGHDNQMSITKERALKFQDEQSAINHKTKNPKVWMYEPKQYEFEMEEK